MQTVNDGIQMRENEVVSGHLTAVFWKFPGRVGKHYDNCNYSNRRLAEIQNQKRR
jgi:hypothetical protein